MHADDCRLSCTAAVTGDLLVFVPEESRALKKVIRKAATERVIDIDPGGVPGFRSVRTRRSWVSTGAIGAASRQLCPAQQWQLTGLSIDLLALRRLQLALRQGKWDFDLRGLE